MSANDKPTESEINEAKNHPNGWVYRIKEGYDPDGRVPPDAILGAWKINDKGVVVGDFIINEASLK